MKVCCIVETVFQLINVLNLRLSVDEFMDAEIDLYVRKDHFVGCKEYSEKIREKELFHGIHYFEFKPYSDSNIVNRLKQIPEFLLARRVIRGALCDDAGFPAKKYDIILTPNCCQFFKEALFCCSNAKVYCYEDGTLSYSGTNWIANEVSSLSKRVLRLLHKEKQLFPERVYINNRSLFIPAWSCSVIQIPSLKDTIEKQKSLFREIFGYPVCDYDACKLVFLSQPNPVPFAVSKQICDCIGAEYIVRYHPRDRQESMYGGSQDRGSSQWELICADNITDEHILIGACSSAQTSPKWFFNKEPYVIFTYEIYGEKLPPAFIEASKIIVEKTKSIYSNPQKIIVPKTRVEFENVMAEIVNRKGKKDV